MKRNAIIIIGLITAFGIMCVWLYFSKVASKHGITDTTLMPETNIINTNNVSPQPQVKSNDDLVRPATVDEPTWSKWLNYRRVVLSENQPIEFYGRVLDQSNQPVQGARLKLRLSRMNEREFSMFNFPNWNPAKAVENIDFEIASDSNGWIEVTKTNGSSISVWGLVKEGYTSSYPDGNFGGVSYEPEGRRNPSGDIEMTNAWNPQKGYIFHLQKVDEPSSGK